MPVPRVVPAHLILAEAEPRAHRAGSVPGRRDRGTDAGELPQRGRNGLSPSPSSTTSEQHTRIHIALGARNRLTSFNASFRKIVGQRPDLHKWEFLRLMQVPWFNWHGRELMSRE